MKSLIICFPLVYCITLAKSQLNAPCTTPDNKMGRCKQFSKCDDLSKLYATKNMTSQQFKFLKDSQCGFLVEDLVCCSPLLSVGDTNHLCIHVDHSDKILGGVNTTIREYRWMAQLEYTHKLRKTVERECGGSIITRRFILTAASCLVQLGNHQLTSVILGEWDTTRNPDAPFYSKEEFADPIQIYKVSKTIVHEDYNKNKNFEHNIGLVKVTKDIIYSEWIKPICVPNSERLKNKNFNGYEIIVAGWGTAGGRYLKASSLKLYAYIAAQSNEQCQTCYNSAHLGLQITDFQFCAGDYGFNSCRGDSGGPAIAHEMIGNTIYTYLAGIVSYGPAACGYDRCAGVYTKVAAYIPWIETNTI